MAVKVNRVHKAKRDPLSFNNIGWPAIAAATLMTAWFLMNYRQFPVAYGNLILVITGTMLVASLASIIMGVWRASFRWKLLSVAIAVVWLVPFIFYAMGLAGPFFNIQFTG